MLSKWLRTPEDVEPYSQLALIYDFVMRHVDYGRWAVHLAELFVYVQGSVQDILDISCGTGSLAIKLTQLGYRLSGFDQSAPMVRQASIKLDKLGFPVPVWQGSMQRFSTKRQYDAVVCTYDSFNYCTTVQSCEAVFVCVNEVLKRDGLFIFDVCTKKNSMKHFRNFYDNEQTKEYGYIRQSVFDPIKKIQSNEFTIQWFNKPQKSYREIHKQKIYSLDEFIKMIPSDKFILVGKYDGFSFEAGTENSERVHFVLRKCR